MTSAPIIDVAATLASARRARVEADEAEARVFLAAVAWAAAHETVAPEDAANWGDASIPLAGVGAPLVSEFCVAEFAAALGMSPMSGRFYLAHAIEIAHRLPRLFDRVQSGKVTVWRARRVAEKTLPLCSEAARYVDAQVAGFAHKIGHAALERLVDEAIARFMPETAAEIAQQAADGRKVEILHDRRAFSGTSTIYGQLDLVDALDLDNRLSAEAAALKDLGSKDSLNVRRAVALGNLARGDVPLPGAAPLRPITLYLHLDPRDTHGRLENAGTKLIAVEQIREWISAPGAHVTVRPVIDLDNEITCTGYQPSDTLREQITLRDRNCVFPWCTRPARRCDADHITSYDPDGPSDQTSTSNLGALCRFHHRLKTHGSWTYTMLEPGVFRWRSPAGYEYLRDQTGTRDLTPRPVDPPGS